MTKTPLTAINRGSIFRFGKNKQWHRLDYQSVRGTHYYNTFKQRSMIKREVAEKIYVEFKDGFILDEITFN
jgi:hypothetical protein